MSGAATTAIFDWTEVPCPFLRTQKDDAANRQPALLPDVKDAQLGELKCYVLVRRGGPGATNNTEKSEEFIRTDSEPTPGIIHNKRVYRLRASRRCTFRFPASISAPDHR